MSFKEHKSVKRRKQCNQLNGIAPLVIVRNVTAFGGLHGHMMFFFKSRIHSILYFPKNVNEIKERLGKALRKTCSCKASAGTV